MATVFKGKDARDPVLRASGSVRPPHFFQDIPLKRFLAFALGLGGFAALANSLADVNRDPAIAFSAYEFLQSYALFASCCLLGLIFSEKASLSYFLLQRPERLRQKALLLLMYGVVPGVLIGLYYSRLFASYRFSPRVPLWVRLIQDAYDPVIYSLRAAITEELVFRLMFFAGFLYILKRLFQPIVQSSRGIAQGIPLVFSVLVSSLLFGLAHGLFGFANAFLAGMVLCLCFLRGGLESAFLCHFLADFVFYSLTYLYTV